jgi:hypothetical protein
VHVCRRWRSITFGLPRHLNLQLVCTNRIRAIDMLDVWPALHLIILCYSAYRIGSVDNIIAVLERRYRACQIDFAKTSRALPRSAQSSGESKTIIWRSIRLQTSTVPSRAVVVSYYALFTACLFPRASDLCSSLACSKRHHPTATL